MQKYFKQRGLGVMEKVDDKLFEILFEKFYLLLF